MILSRRLITEFSFNYKKDYLWGVTQGKNSSDYSISDFIDIGIIIEIPKEVRTITKNHLQAHEVEKNSFIFFKTRHSYESKSGTLQDEYVYIESDAVEELLKVQARVIGIDYISVDSIENKNLPVHHRLLENNILIVENPEVREIDPGRCIVHLEARFLITFLK